MVKERKTVAIVQARTGSTRLPKKVLLPLPYGGKTTVLEQIVNRAKKCGNIDDIIIATSTARDDDSIKKLCDKIHIKCFRGSEENVLSRYYGAAKESGADVVIRLTGDNPCIDAGFLERTIDFHIRSKNDYSHTKGLPLGMNLEIMSFDALEEANSKAVKGFEKEHVTPYFYQSHPEKFKLGCLKVSPSFANTNIRVTLDTPEDYALICLVYGELYGNKKYFSVSDVVKLFNKKSWISLINNRIVQKKIFKNIKDEIKEAVSILDMQDLKRARDILAKRIKT
jgi:spore coat polysaccharide biosynthesis protein SpsF